MAGEVGAERLVAWMAALLVAAAVLLVFGLLALRFGGSGGRKGTRTQATRRPGTPATTEGRATDDQPAAAAGGADDEDGSVPEDDPAGRAPRGGG